MQAARLTLGEIYLDSNVFDSYRFTGINLASDERMLPPNLQGYAPEVRGIAKSNAKITVSGRPHAVRNHRACRAVCDPGSQQFGTWPTGREG